jgi:hypothetical protein
MKYINSNNELIQITEQLKLLQQHDDDNEGKAKAKHVAEAIKRRDLESRTDMLRELAQGHCSHNDGNPRLLRSPRTAGLFDMKGLSHQHIHRSPHDHHHHHSHSPDGFPSVASTLTPTTTTTITQSVPRTVSKWIEKPPPLSSITDFVVKTAPRLRGENRDRYRIFYQLLSFHVLFDD